MECMFTTTCYDRLYCNVRCCRFFVEAVQLLEGQSSRQGIFRKAGSVARQKALRVNSLSYECSVVEIDTHVHHTHARTHTHKHTHTHSSMK